MDRDVRDPAADHRGDRSRMSGSLPLGFFIAHMSGADFFGLVVSVLVIAYLFYALIRGEKL
jgi:K+-transporting ATPase KdpF subunit